MQVSKISKLDITMMTATHPAALTKKMKMTAILMQKCSAEQAFTVLKRLKFPFAFMNISEKDLNLYR